MADGHVVYFLRICQGEFFGQLLGDVAIYRLQIARGGDGTQISFHQFPIVLDEGEENVRKFFFEKRNGFLHKIIDGHNNK